MKEEPTNPTPCHHLLLRKGARPSIAGGVRVTLFFSLVRTRLFCLFIYIVLFFFFLGWGGGVSS